MNQKNVKQISGAALKLFFMLLFWFALMQIVFPAKRQAAPAMAEADIQVNAVQDVGEKVTPVSPKLIPLGKTTGIKLFSQGTMIVGFADLQDCGNTSPAKAAGLQMGDVIIAVDAEEIDSNEDLVEALQTLDDETAVLTVQRDNARMDVTVNAYYDPQMESWRIGAWVRDSIAGIGTITFVDPANGAFGALGHGICDADTGELMPFEKGSIMGSSVVDVKKGKSGAPGELNGAFDMTCDQGTLYANTHQGIFGRITDEAVYADEKAVEIAAGDEIRPGKATVLCNVEGTQREAFDIEIEKVYQDSGENLRDMLIRITDKELLKLTGGIVQGMSGSPIIQDGKLIGAVTHVLVNDPEKGYAISIENMLDAA